MAGIVASKTQDTTLRRSDIHFEGMTKQCCVMPSKIVNNLVVRR